MWLARVSASVWSCVTYRTVSVGQIAMQPGELVEHRAADLRVERRQRLVQQQHLGPDRERARDRDALLLAARELARIALRIARHADHAQAFGDPRRG